MLLIKLSLADWTLHRAVCVRLYTDDFFFERVRVRDQNETLHFIIN